MKPNGTGTSGPFEPAMRNWPTSERRFREALGIYQNLKDLEDRRTCFGIGRKGWPRQYCRRQSASFQLRKLSVEVQKILQNWHFPNADRVFFDQKTRDLVINGKNRTSFGKGLRAITQSAFTIGLLEYCKQQGTPHPGFALLDSPSYSPYKESDGADDDLRHTDLKMRFYDYLKHISDDQQVIVVENTDPPDDVRAMPRAQRFTGNPEEGRAGLFPLGPVTAIQSPS